MVERLFGGKPILEADAGHHWESRVVLNPAADLAPVDTDSPLLERWDLTSDQRLLLVESGAAVVMLFRAQGAPAEGHDVAPSSLGLAVFTRDYELVKRWDRPVVSPSEGYQNLGVEDPRVTLVGDTWHAYYTAYHGDPSTGHWDDRRIYICHASTRDFLDWTLNGPIVGSLNQVANKNAVLLPATVGGDYILLHRPMEGPDSMAIHYATASAPTGPWDDRGLVMRGLDRPECSRSWVGSGGPPIPLGDDRFLMIYHRGSFDHADRREYDLGAALLDFRSDEIVCSRIEPIMQPLGRLEQVGDPEVGVDNVLFTCANYVDGDRLVIPYAGADSRIFVGQVEFSELVDALESLA